MSVCFRRAISEGSSQGTLGSLRLYNRRVTVIVSNGCTYDTYHLASPVKHEKALLGSAVTRSTTLTVGH